MNQDNCDGSGFGGVVQEQRRAAILARHDQTYYFRDEIVKFAEHHTKGGYGAFPSDQFNHFLSNRPGIIKNFAIASNYALAKIEGVSPAYQLIQDMQSAVQKITETVRI